MLGHLLRFYLVRMGWEIAAFWLLSSGSSFAMAGDSPAAICLGLARLETIAAVWITVRLLVAEEGFHTSGGWQVRPIPVWVPPVTQLILLGIAFLLPWTLRVLILHRYLGMDAGGLNLLIKRVWWPDASRLLGFAVVVKLAAHFIWRRSRGLQWAAWSMFAIVILVGTLKLCNRTNPPAGHDESIDRIRGASSLSHGIQRLLPDAKDFVGAWNARIGPDIKVPAAKLVLRVPIGGASTFNNVRMLGSEASLRGVRGVVTAEFRGTDMQLLERLHDACVVMRYADGTYGTCSQYRRYLNRGFGLNPEVYQFDFSGSFVSPLCLPEHVGNPTKLLEGNVELLFFEKDPTAPDFTPTTGWVYGRPYTTNRSDQSLPAVQTPADPDPLAESTYHQIDWLSFRESGSFVRPSGVTQQSVPSLPYAAMPYVLKRFPWSDSAWERLVHPFLLAHARASDIPVLLDHMEFDPRLGALFVEKGWAREAMPWLRRFVKDRLPLDPSCIGAVAAERDPSLTADIEAVALQSEGCLTQIESSLREQPNFNWPSFVKAGWKTHKYRRSSERGYNYHPFRLWAAQEGDASALRALAEALAKNELRGKTDVAALAAIVAGDHEDLLSYLRENIGRMTFDPQSRKWIH